MFKQRRLIVTSSRRSSTASVRPCVSVPADRRRMDRCGNPATIGNTAHSLARMAPVLALFFLCWLLRGRDQLSFFLGKEPEDGLAFGFVRLGAQQLSKVLNVQVSDRLVRHGPSL